MEGPVKTLKVKNVTKYGCTKSKFSQTGQIFISQALDFTEKLKLE